MNEPKELYLSLLKKTLAFTLWPEPPIPIETFNDYRKPLVKRFVLLISGLLKKRGFQLVKQSNYTDHQKENGMIWPGYADTMIGLKRLDNIQFCVETVLQEHIEGDLVETGVWRGGACIFMRAILAAHGTEDRKIYVVDSFEGLPKPNPEKFPADKGDTHHMLSYLVVSQEEVENNFRKYDLLDEKVVFLKGWFKDTLPKAPIKKLSILRLDGDMYESTMDTLQNLYPKLTVGGFCIIDDYALAGCKKAVDDFRANNGIVAEMKVVDWTGRYWRKE